MCACLSNALCFAGYVHPLPEKTPLTSTFGEYRLNHFHGGLDFSTGGETGMDVFAVAAGYVWRIRVSGAGYGRALYIAQDDGSTAVYAHLNDFSARIEDVAAAEQRRAGKYGIDFTLPGSGLRVSAGELIAHSGESGAGPPHLHFELRKGEVQINPLEAGVEASDSRPPRILSIVLIPLGPNSMVDGRSEALSVGLRWDPASSTYRTSRTPTVQGDVAVASRLYDLADGKPNRLAPYGAALTVDGVTCYDVRFDAVSLGSTRHVEFVYNYDYARRGGRNVLNLFCAPGRDVGLTADETPMRGVMRVEGSGEAGSVPLKHGLHRVRVEAWDFAGNRRAAEMDVIANNRPVLLEASLDEETGDARAFAMDPDGDEFEILIESSMDSGETWSETGGPDSAGVISGGRPAEGRIQRLRAVDEWNSSSIPAYLGPGLCSYFDAAPALGVLLRDGYLEAVCDFGRPSAQVPEMWLVNGAAARPIMPLRAERTGPGSFRAVTRLSGILENGASLMAVAHGPDGRTSVLKPLSLIHIVAGTQGDVSLPGGAVLCMKAGTFIGETFVMTAVGDSIQTGAFGELVPMSRSLRCDPPTQFFGSSGTLYLPLEGVPASRDRVGIYQKVGEREWRWIGRERRGRDLVGGAISHFSTYALMEDVEAPRVTRLRPRAGSRLSVASPTLEARLRDGGSGLDWDNVYFTIDGDRLITAWEAEDGKAWARVPRVLAPGSHEARFFAADNAGNETVVETTFYVVR